MVGPYSEFSKTEFEELPLPADAVGSVVAQMRQAGLDVHYGKWLIDGEPRVALMNVQSVMGRLSSIKYVLWEHHAIASPAGDPLIDGCLAFGNMVEQFLFRLSLADGLNVPIVAHFHEWMAGSAIPELRRGDARIAIVFTTHATLLGRYLALSDPWFYDHVPFVNWLADARHFNIETQVRIERAAAHGAHVFTTVSEITAFECQHLDGRAVDLLLPNGLNLERFIAPHELQNRHARAKEKIDQFVMGHFFPSYCFDLDKTLYFFSSGRYEYRNKGFDLTLQALGRLNWRLKQENVDKTVIFFLSSRRPFRSIIAEVLQSRAQMEEIRKTCELIKEELGQRLFLATARGQRFTAEDLIDRHWMLLLRRMRQLWRIHRLPAIVTHDLEDDSTDEVLNELRAMNLINRPEDSVKVIYYPDFMNSMSPLLGMDYEEFVRGCHLGIFPSFYEPWGYTPLECMARGVAAITSDLAGFGTYLMQNIPGHDRCGVHVVHRRYCSHEAVLDELTDLMMHFVRMERRERIELRNRVESAAEHFDWRHFIRHYFDAYRMALARSAIPKRHPLIEVEVQHANRGL